MFNRSLVEILLMIPAILIGFTFHEYAHAVVADRLGDKTPRFQGRLTFNPIAHVDLIGFIMILLVGFGWAKPVQTNPTAFKHYYKDHLKVAIAGPLTNLLVSILFTVIFVIYQNFIFNLIPSEKVALVIAGILFFAISTNIMLFYFKSTSNTRIGRISYT